MKQLYFFILLLLIVGAVGELIEYHGNRRYWTLLNLDQTTHVALHILKEPVKIIFPVEKPLHQILSDMKLYSPTGNGKCQDTAHILNFKLAFDGEKKYIRGEIKVVVDDEEKNVKMFMYEKCGRTEKSNYYVTGILEDQELKLEHYTGRSCFKPADPFHQYGTNTAKNVMELNVTSNGFECQVFLILPPYMYVEDVALADNGLVKLNDSYAGHEESFWWKSENDQMLPSAVSFGAEDNVIINILNSTKAVPHFFRIGNFSLIPSLVFKFSANCVDFKSELYLNFHDEPGCRIGIQVTEHGFKFSTKGSSEWKAFKDPTKSPTVVFDQETKKVYVKVKSADIPSITVFGDCEVGNLPSVAADQLVVKIGPEGAVSSICDSANVTLIRKDLARPIDALIDRTKIIQPNITTNGPKNENATNAGTSESGKDAKAGLEWWWILVIIVVLLVIIVPGIIITYVCIRRKRKNKKPKNVGPPRSNINHDKDQPKSPGATTAIPPESPKKRKNKKNKKKKNKKDGELDESSKTSSKRSNKKNAKPKSKSKPTEREDQYQPMPSKQNLPPKPFQDYSAIQTTQTEPTTVETGSTQAASQKSVPETVEKVAKPRPKFRYRSMYGAGGFGQMTEPFDYHLNEGSTYEPAMNFAAAFKLTPTPELKQFDNFWSCLEPIAEAKRYSPVFVNSKLPGRNIYFMIRDCVADESLYSPFRTLSNRMLESLKSDPGRNKNSEPYTVDGEKKFYILRLFILSYEPLTLEIHCRGQCPLFLFSLFECEQCPEVAKRLQKNAWMNSQATCHEDWDTFVCRVKRAPINSHQFLSYNGPEKPKNSEEMNHVMIIRGDKQPNKLRDCKRGCTFSDMSHPNNITIETELQGDPTLQTQVTQPSSKER